MDMSRVKIFLQTSLLEKKHFQQGPVLTRLLMIGILVGFVGLFSACSPETAAPLEPSIPGGMGDAVLSKTPEIRETVTATTAAVPEQAVESEETDLLLDLPESPVLTIWHGFLDEDLFLLKGMLDEFQSQVPEIRFELTYVPYDDLRERYIQAIDTGKGPDLLFGAGEWGPGFFDLGVIKDSSILISPVLRSQLNPAGLAAVSYKDVLTGLPYELRGIVMYRNNAIMPEAPATFQELVNRAQGLTRGGILGAYLERGDLYALPQLTACGGKLYSEEGFPNFNSLAGQCWVQLLRAYETAGPVSFNSHEDLNRFMDGSVGMIMDGTWNLEKVSASLGGLLEVDPWPMYGEDHLSGYVWTENIYPNPRLDEGRRQVVRALFDFMLSTSAQGMIASHSRVPAIVSLETDQPWIPQIMAALSMGTPYPTLPEIKFYWEPLHQALVTIFEQEGDALMALQQASDQIIEAIRQDRNMEDNLIENSLYGTGS